MKVIFVDRDDTLNEDPGYLNDPARVRLLPGVAAGLRLLAEAGFRFIILTNQSGVGRGMIRSEELQAVHRRLYELLEEQGIGMLDLFFCPHVDEDECDCRKPKPGLLWQALDRHPDIDLSLSWIVGDRFRDLVPGLNPLRPGREGSPPIQPILRGVLVGTKPEVGVPPANLVFRAGDLFEAAAFICSNTSRV